MFESDKKALAKWDVRPVTPGHALVIPRRHVSYEQLTEGEIIDVWNLLNRVKITLDEQYQPDGYNVGFNQGTTAGQTLDHPHVHVIPRYKDDTTASGGLRLIVSGFRAPDHPYTEGLEKHAGSTESDGYEGGPPCPE